MNDISDLEFIGGGLSRPECVLAHSSGLLFASDWTGAGGISIIAPEQRTPVGRILSTHAHFTLRPNGIALDSNGRLLAAHLGEDVGGVFHLHADGALQPLITDVAGVALPPTNFVHVDSRHRLWATVSTRHRPRSEAFRNDVADGFIVLADTDGGNARVVADGLGYTNECVMHPDGERLFVNETFARRLLCFDVTGRGDLVNRRVIGEFGPGTFPDGIAFDEEGGVWVTSIVSNRVIRITEDGRQQVVVEDARSDFLDEVEAAFQSGRMGRPHLDSIRGAKLGHVSSLAFGGRDRRTVYLGCLLGERLASFRSPYRGVAPLHWNAPLTSFGSYLEQ